jgi:hypothetical protein
MAQINYGDLWNYLEEFSEKRFQGTHNIHTTQTIVKNVVSNIIHYKNKHIFLALYNLEWVVELLTCGVKPKDIVFMSDNTRKSSICDKLGVKYIMSIDDFKSKKRPVVLINSPYTNGEQDASEIYTDILERVVDKTSPIAVGGVSPENFINGGQKKKTLRYKMLDLFKLKMLTFLDQKRDWNKSISIDTISFVFDESHVGNTTVNGRFLGKSYDVNMSALGIKELANGETQEIHDWLMSIQTVKKVPLKVSKKTAGTDRIVKLSKKDIDSFTTEQGDYFDSNNTQWRVVFGYMRANVCAVVPPNISVPSKYRYVPFDSEDSARKFRDFMLSEPVRFIMKMTYTSRTLDAPQISYVPWIDLSSFNSVDDNTLYNHWNTTNQSQNIINSIVSDEVPF